MADPEHMDILAARASSYLADALVICDHCGSPGIRELMIRRWEHDKGCRYYLHPECDQERRGMKRCPECDGAGEVVRKDTMALLNEIQEKYAEKPPPPSLGELIDRLNDITQTDEVMKCNGTGEVPARKSPPAPLREGF